MNWIVGFELMCYAIVALLLADIIRRRRDDELWLFVSGVFAGLALELLAVRVTGMLLASDSEIVTVYSVDLCSDRPATLCISQNG